MTDVVIVGAGVTGLAAGMSSGAPIYEQSDGPGGICRSYYVRPGDDTRFDHAPSDGNAYRFELGGGHWIFGGDADVLARLIELVPFTRYRRRAAVRLAALGATIPYPLQDHVDMLGLELSHQIAHERSAVPACPGEPATLRAWLKQAFGATLCELFFFPFHERYTAGLCDLVAPEDGYKSPALPVTSRSFAGGGLARPAGYNADFCYPEGGLDELVAAMAARCDVRYGRRLVGIDRFSRTMQFADGTEREYETLVSTLPLDRVIELADLEVEQPSDPFTSVLVLNIGAERGRNCPQLHWQYEPDACSGFHRIGFYSGVDQSFLPRQHRAAGRHVSLYVERAFRAGEAPSTAELAHYVDAAVGELQGRGYINATEVVDPSWVEVAYTWRRPGSDWREKALADLAADGIHQVGRYGRWHFQGIADSVRDGLALGARSATLRAPRPSPESHAQ